MKKILFVLACFLIIFSQLEAKDGKAGDIRELFSSSLTENEAAFMFLGFSGIVVRTSKRTIIIDPADMLKAEDLKALKEKGADLVLFTHSHGDHYTLRDTLNIFKETGAPVLAERIVAMELEGKIPADKLISGSPGKTYTFGEITVNVIQGRHVGPINLYQIKIGDLSIFHGGDSAYVSLKNYPSDLAFLPTGDPSPTASPQDAFNMASDLKPSVVVAIHGSSSQSKDFENRIKRAMPNTTVIIAEPFASKVVSIAKKT
jgi:L-ascorbate metabolism protein UlaG (beta-lactamase superfamily)